MSTPLIDNNLAFRLSADWMEKTSFVDGWEGFPTVHDPRDFEATTLRGKLLLQPDSIPEWRTLLTLNHSVYTGPQTENVDRPFSHRDSSYLFEPVFEPKTSSAILDTQYALTENLSLEGLFTGTDLEVRRKAQPGDGIALIEGREYVVEPRLRFHSETLGTGIVGIHNFRSHQDESLDSAGGLIFRDSVDTLALFGESTVPLNQHFDLTVGARYEEEHHDRSGGNDFVIVDLDKTYYAFLPKVGVAWHLAPETTVGVQVSRGYNGGGAGAAFDVFPVVTYQYDPEYVTTYELYGRHLLADSRVQLTGNIFYSDYTDMQLTKDLTPGDTADFSFVVINADKVKTYGAEGGVTWLAQPQLEVYANLGLLKTEITRYDGSYQDNELPNSPTCSLSGGISWKNAGWDANLNGRHLNSYYSDAANQPRGKVDPYFVANAELGYTFGQVRIYGEVNNLLDSDSELAVYPGATREEDGANVLAPRMYTVGAQYNF